MPSVRGERDFCHVHSASRSNAATRARMNGTGNQDSEAGSPVKRGRGRISDGFQAGFARCADGIYTDELEASTDDHG